MTDLNKLLTPLYLNEKEIRKIIEMLFFSYKDFTAGPDKILEKINFGRAHHRVIYFVGKQKTLTIGRGVSAPSARTRFLFVSFLFLSLSHHENPKK